MVRRRTTVLFAVVAILLAACGGGGGDSAAGDDAGTADQAASDEGDAADGGDGAADDPAGAESSEPPLFPWEKAAQGQEVEGTVPLSEIRSGGPPPDGIPPIDDPVFESVEAASQWLAEDSPLMVVEHKGETRGYPLAILTFHEIVNDIVAGDPLLVTYCPLCNSAFVFDSTIDGERVTFGTSGRLWNSNLVMYDRPTRTLWAQFTGEAIIGPRTGTELERLPVQTVAFSDFEQSFPDADVLSRDTGHNRPYGENPYTGYDSASSPFLFDGETGGPLAQMDRVVVLDEPEDVAYPLSRLEEERAVNDTVGDLEIAVLWSPGTASALDTRTLSEGRDVGSVGVFDRTVDGQTLTFRPEGEKMFVDEETGSTWNVLGQAVSGELEGTELEEVTFDDTFWFVQFAFAPETDVRTG